MSSTFDRKQCIVKSCDKKDVRKFSLPSDLEGAKLWLELLDRKDLLNHRNISNLRVCEVHFAPHMLTASGKRLVQWAVPNKIIADNETTEDLKPSIVVNENKTTKIITTEPILQQTKAVEIKKIGNTYVTATKGVRQITQAKIIKLNHIGNLPITNVSSSVTKATSSTATATSVVNKNESHDSTEVLNFEIKDENTNRNVMEKATIITADKIDFKNKNNEFHKVIETIKVNGSQIITLSPNTITTKQATIQSYPTIKTTANIINTSPTALNKIPVTTSPLKTKTMTAINNNTTLNQITLKRKPILVSVTNSSNNNNNNNSSNNTNSASVNTAKNTKIRRSDLINLAQQAINEAKNPQQKVEDQFDLIGKRIAIDLRQMDSNQTAIAEKLVNDVIYYGKIGQLRETSSFNPFYSSAPAPIVSTVSSTPTVIQTALNQQQPQQQSSNQTQQQHQQQQQQQQQQQHKVIQTITMPIMPTSTQTITIPPVGSLITAPPLVSAMQVAGTNQQIIYAVSSSQNTTNQPSSAITINGQATEEANSSVNGGDKCQWWSRNLAYI